TGESFRNRQNPRFQLLAYRKARTGIRSRRGGFEESARKGKEAKHQTRPGKRTRLQYRNRCRVRETACRDSGSVSRPQLGSRKCLCCRREALSGWIPAAPQKSNPAHAREGCETKSSHRQIRLGPHGRG